MTQEEALALIDAHKNALINPVEMLGWTHLRVIINSIAPDEWDELLARAMEVLAK